MVSKSVIQILFEGVDIRLNLVDVLGQVNQSGNVNGELSKNGANDIHIEDVWLGTLLGETLNRLRGNSQYKRT